MALNSQQPHEIVGLEVADIWILVYGNNTKIWTNSFETGLEGPELED
jgi:hypothetical protein